MSPTRCTTASQWAMYVELVERVAAEILEVLLDLHRDVVPREIAVQLIAVSTELVGNSRKKDDYWHGAPAC